MIKIKSVKRAPNERNLYDLGVEKNHNFFADMILVHNCHRFSSTQSDVLLPLVESGLITFIGATTENPFHALTGPLVSRSQVFRLEPLSEKELAKLMIRAVQFCKKLNIEVGIEPDAARHMIRMACGDGRKLISIFETCVDLAENGVVTAEIAIGVAPSKYMPLTEDAHFDHGSAFQGSIQASDPDAAIFWLARWLESGEDPRYIARRLMVAASEDSASSPEAAIIAHSAYVAACEIGRPECDIILAHTAILVATSQRDKSAAFAIWEALKDVQQSVDVAIPKEMRDCHYNGAKELGHGAYKDGKDQTKYVGVNKIFYKPPSFSKYKNKNLEDNSNGRSD